MTELSAAAGIVGLIMAAAHTTRRLSNDIRNIVDAPTTVQDLNAEVGLLESSITSLEAIKEQHWESLDKGIAQRSEVAIKTCKSSCESQLEELREWTKRSAGGKRSWRESVNIGFFKTKEIKAMAGQLQKCKSSLDLVVNIVTLSVYQASALKSGAFRADTKAFAGTPRTARPAPLMLSKHSSSLSSRACLLLLSQPTIRSLSSKTPSQP